MTLEDIVPEIRKNHCSRNIGALHAFIEETPCSFPLKSCSVRANIAGVFCTSHVVQVFENTYDSPLDVIYIFPLPPDAAVVEMVMKCGDLSFKAECREKEAAITEFEEAKSLGQTAGLITQRRGDVHTLSVANVPAGKAVEISFQLVERLPVVDGELRYRFPTTLPPRYTPGEPVGQSGPGVVAETDQVPDASFFNPPVVLENGALFQAEVHVENEITSVASALHATRSSLGKGVTVALNAQVKMDSDFILHFKLPEENVRTQAWTDGTHTSILLTPDASMKPESIPREAVFIVDISGSMRGQKMEAAKLALHTAIRSLMPNDRFRLIAFDDRIDIHNTEFSKVTDENLEIAGNWIDELSPRGGTEMLPALEKGFEQNISEGFQRTVLFITDGQAWNEDELVKAVTRQRKGARLFTLGIDTAVNEQLLKRMSKAGEGTCELCTPFDDIEERVALLESRMGHPLLHSITTNLGRENGCHGTLFKGRPVGFIVKGTPSEIIAKQGKNQWSLELIPEFTETSLGVSWAKHKIQEHEERITLQPNEAEAIRPKILELGLTFGLVTKYTALVAVDPREQSRENVARVLQPHLFPAGWQTSIGGFARPMASAEPPSRPSAVPPISTSMTSRRLVTSTPKKFNGKLLDNKRENKNKLPSEQEGHKTKLGLSAIIKLQSANGSINHDLNETVASLLAFLLRGNTRTTGVRMRNVIKMVLWLEAQPDSDLKMLALEQLRKTERYGKIKSDVKWAKIAPGTPAAELLS